MANETLIDKDQLNIPSNLDDLKLYGVNTEENPNTDGQVNASLLAQALGGQTGNIANSHYGDLPSVAFTANDDPQPLYDALNALPLQLVPHGKTYTFSTVRITATSATSFIADKRFYRFRSALTNGADAQGAYFGVGSGITLNASNMKFRRFEQLIITSENGVVTGTSAYDLGNIGTTSVADAVNGSTSTYTESNGVIVMTATDGTTQQYYIYNGSETVIGNGGNAVTNDDFTVVDPATSVPAASDLNQIQKVANTYIKGSGASVTTKQELGALFNRVNDDGTVGAAWTPEEIEKYITDFKVVGNDIECVISKRYALDSSVGRPNFPLSDCLEFIDFEGWMVAFSFQNFRGNTTIEKMVVNGLRTIANSSDVEGATSLRYFEALNLRGKLNLKDCVNLENIVSPNVTNWGDVGKPPTKITYEDFPHIAILSGKVVGKGVAEIDLPSVKKVISAFDNGGDSDTTLTKLSITNTEILDGVSFRNTNGVELLDLRNATSWIRTSYVQVLKMQGLKLLNLSKLKTFGSAHDVVDDMFDVSFAANGTKFILNEFLKTSNNGGINANVQDAIDRGVTVVWVSDYNEVVEEYVLPISATQGEGVTVTNENDGVKVVVEGITGEQGAQGIQGINGADGGEEGVVWSRTLADANAINPKDVNKAYAVDSDSVESNRGYYVWDGSNLIKNRPLENFTYFNLYDKTNNSAGSGYLRSTTGAAAGLGAIDGLEFQISGYIDVVGGRTYTLQGLKAEIVVGVDARAVVFYDASNALLKPLDLAGNEYPTFSIPTLNGSFKAPPTAVQMRFNAKYYSLPTVIDDIQLTEGSVNLQYIPFLTKGRKQLVVVPSDVAEGHIMIKKGQSYTGLDPNELATTEDRPVNDLGYPIYGAIAGTVANFQSLQFEEVNQIPNTGQHLIFHNGNLVFVNEGVITNLV